MGSIPGAQNWHSADTMSWTTFFSLASLLSIIRVACGCTCAGTIIEDGNTGRNIGECLTQLRGRYWCYVNPNIWCPDKTLSSRSFGGLNLYYSYDACSSQSTESTPSIAPQESLGVRSSIPQQRTRNPPTVARARRDAWRHNSAELGRLLNEPTRFRNDLYGVIIDH